MDRNERRFWPADRKRHLVVVYLGVVYLVALLAMAFAPVALAQTSERCPGESAAGAPPLPPGTEIIHQGGASGSFTHDGVTISWDGTEITVSGGSITVCVKSATTATGIITLDAGTYSTADLGLTGPQGQAQGVSHLVVYDTTTTTTTPPGTTTTPPGTTTTPPGGTSTSTATPPSPTVLAGSETNTGSPSPLAFTGREDLPWLIGAGLLLLLIGSLALRLGSKPSPQAPTDWSA
jgi:hypothetical protein